MEWIPLILLDRRKINGRKPCDYRAQCLIQRMKKPKADGLEITMDDRVDIYYWYIYCSVCFVDCDRRVVSTCGRVMGAMQYGLLFTFDMAVFFLPFFGRPWVFHSQS